MRTSKTLARIRQHKVARTTALGHFIPSYVCHAARAGYDCIWLDMEHRTWNAREAQSILSLCHLYDIDCLLRPPTLEKTGLYRYLEDGATGLLIPHVSTPEKARLLVDATKFPPIGDRGLDNAGLDSGFRATDDALGYTDWANRETFLAVQIETPEAVRNCDQIAAIEGVDLLFVGAGDLGLRLAHSGGGEAELEAAFERVSSVCRQHNQPWGCPVGSADELKRRRDQGASLLANFGEYLCLKDGLTRAAGEFE